MPRLWRATPVIALATVIVLLSAGVWMARYVDRANARQEADQVGVQARILAATVTAALSFNDRQAAQEYVNAIRANPQIEAAAIYDASGKLFVSYRAAPDIAVPSTARPAAPRFSNEHLVVAVPVVQGSISLGTVYLRSLTEPFALRLQRYGVIGLLMTMASVVVAVLGVTHRAQRRANEELARRAEQLAAANQALEAQIAQRERAEEALRHSQKMEAIGQLTGGVAHDFNNLLQVILGNLERLGRRLPEAPATETGRLIAAATRAAGRAATLTQRLLAFSRRQPLTPKSLDLNRLVAGMLELFGRTLGEAIQVDTMLAGGLWRVFADENQLENALVNLAVNARDAMPHGGRLTLETRNVRLDESYALTQEDVRPGDYVLVTVSDTGTGMTKEVLARAFDPFFTTKDIGQGTGLGLSQVYGFVRQSGGHVRIDSTIGQGTTVSLYLPRFFELEKLDTSAAAPQALPLGKHHEAILIVEDEHDVRSFTRETLQELGYEVREAASGSAALRALEASPNLRLLFTDIGLPGGMNGRQLAEEARRRRPELKVLLTTGYTRDT
ncbi:MAG TPA: ATP-binding protein, partial [Acetobacteraceae bacterium]|nr:ATP-binding protein [Acetobacteraceae bacterium]